jgi:hypothetical protein
MSDCNDIPAPQAPPTYAPDDVVIYGVKLNSPAFPFGEVKASASQTPAGERTVMRLQLWSEPAPGADARVLESDECSIVVAYGYSYEGHCYRFDRPRLFLVKVQTDSEAVGCGFDAVAGPSGTTPYRMWRVRSDQPLLEVQTTLDTVQAIVLDANLPGKRAPNTYANDMQMAHRGGRLTRD